MIKLKQYRDPWLFEKVDEVVGFYPREYYCLDNFSSFKVTYRGHKYSSVEEAYQAAKFIDVAPEIAETIMNCNSAHEAQKIARENASKQRTDWNEVKLRVMEDLLRAKLSENPYVRKKLLELKGCIIVEDSPKDSYWGWGADRLGQNQLGKLWMKLCDELVESK